ncbi:MAG: hypothetical protein GY750_07205 [Lentisphaerae bacterium]|nr:hypothetical protein [Lentisphaerota bacterium]
MKEEKKKYKYTGEPNDKRRFAKSMASILDELIERKLKQQVSEIAEIKNLIARRDEMRSICNDSEIDREIDRVIY